MTTRDLVRRAARSPAAKGDGLDLGQAVTPTRIASGTSSSQFQDMLSDRLLLSPAEACKLLSIKKTTLYKWLKLGLIRSTKIGGKRLIQAGSVLELSAACGEHGEPTQR